MTYFKYSVTVDGEPLYIISVDDKKKYKVFSKNGEVTDEKAIGYAKDGVYKMEADEIDIAEFNMLLVDFKKTWVDNTSD